MDNPLTSVRAGTLISAFHNKIQHLTEGQQDVHQAVITTNTVKMGFSVGRVSWGPSPSHSDNENEQHWQQTRPDPPDKYVIFEDQELCCGLLWMKVLFKLV